ncbi:MAG: hypothetical protein PUB93_02445 [Firmicutes bacterium]|nr:hypothetical protein [Bacillota bacterium]
MKDFWVRLIAIGAVLALTAAPLSACGDAGDPPTTASTFTEPPASVTKPSETEPPETEPPVTEPPETEPPVTEPPVTEPPETEPPETEPPVTEPPVTEPPETEPPETEPPETEPPVTEPPAPVNDIGKPITKDEFTVTVTSVHRSGNEYIIELTLSFAGTGEHPLNARERFFLVNGDRRSVSVEDIRDADGSSLMGTSISGGQTLAITAVFTVTGDFTPSEFRYVYDINGFRRVQVKL